MRTRIVAMSVLPVAALLLLVACGGGEETPAAEPAQAAEPAPAPAEPASSPGDPDAGAELFASEGCGGCHTLAAAGTSGATGPNLDEELAPDAEAAGIPLEQFVRESIVDPNATIAQGYPADVMPKTYGPGLDDQALDDLVAFIVQAVEHGVVENGSGGAGRYGLGEIPASRSPVAG